MLPRRPTARHIQPVQPVQPAQPAPIQKTQAQAPTGWGRTGGGAAQYDYSKPMYTTGQNERKVVTMPDGQQVRMAPNTAIYRPQPANPWQNFIDKLLGRARPTQPSGVNGVRG